MTEDSSFDIGKKVFLNSGGPPISIIDRDGNKATCVWFAKNGECKSKKFPIAVLTEADNEIITMLVRPASILQEQGP